MQPLSSAPIEGDQSLYTIPPSCQKLKPASPLCSQTKGTFTMPIESLFGLQSNTKHSVEKAILFPSQINHKKKHKLMKCATSKKLICLVIVEKRKKTSVKDNDFDSNVNKRSCDFTHDKVALSIKSEDHICTDRMGQCDSKKTTY